MLFFEKIPENYFSIQLIENFKLILAFLNSDNRKNFIELNRQFHNYILIKEKILLNLMKMTKRILLAQYAEQLEIRI